MSTFNDIKLLGEDYVKTNKCMHGNPFSAETSLSVMGLTAPLCTFGCQDVHLP